jgi:hypothetical protein
VCDTDFAPLAEDPTGRRLYALAHGWVADTATPVFIPAQNVDDPTSP